MKQGAELAGCRTEDGPGHTYYTYDPQQVTEHARLTVAQFDRLTPGFRLSCP